MVLFFDVLHYHFIGHVATAATEVSPRPDVSSPELLLKVRKLLQQFIGRLPFQPLQQAADGHLWRDAHKQMYMIARDVTFHYRDFVFCTNLSNQVSHSQTNFTCKSRTTIFSRPDNVQMNLKYGVSATPVIFHATTLAWQSNLLKPSPKGEGFDPPRLRQSKMTKRLFVSAVYLTLPSMLRSWPMMKRTEKYLRQSGRGWRLMRSQVRSQVYSENKFLN